MFRPLRRKKNEIGTEAARQLLAAERRGVLAVNGDDGYPYAVPINFMYSPEDNKIFFHGTRVGYKADCIRRSDKVCFTVFGHETVGDEAWAPYLQSVVVFGRCRPAPRDEHMIDLLRRFAGKYYPDAAAVEEEIAASAKAVQMYEIEIEHISGKQVQEK